MVVPVVDAVTVIATGFPLAFAPSASVHAANAVYVSADLNVNVRLAMSPADVVLGVMLKMLVALALFVRRNEHFIPMRDEAFKIGAVIEVDVPTIAVVGMTGPTANTGVAD